MVYLPDDIIIKINGYLETKCIVCNNMFLNKFKNEICSNKCWYVFWFINIQIIFLPFLFGGVLPILILYYCIFHK